MKPSDLPDADRTKLIVFIAKRRDDLAKLARRMEKAGFYGDDPCYQAVVAAHHALHAAVNCIPPAAHKLPVGPDSPLK